MQDLNYQNQMGIPDSHEHGLVRRMGSSTEYANAEQEARVCTKLAVARLEDADGGFSVRRYFRI